tara:strand:+ start:345 stop:578 length:234 start_codon:yes stop_codon:yes gene_type:complete
MSELIEEYEEPKTHSIVSCADNDPCELRSGHIGELVTYKGVTGWLIRYVTTCKHQLLALSLTEARECLKLNAPDTDI